MNQDHRCRVTTQFAADIARRTGSQKANRKKLVEAVALDEDELRRFDSALKKTTAFMRKLKTVGAGAGAALIDEMSKLNLSKFVDEIAAALGELRLKLSDVAFIVEFCVAVSSRYASFSELLLATFRKNLPLKKSDKVTNPSKLRIDLRLLFELFLNGVFAKEGLQVYGAALSFLVQTDKTEHVHVGLISGLLTQVGWEMAFVVPTTAKGDDIGSEDLPVSEALTREQMLMMRQLFFDYHKSLAERTEKACRSMNVVQKRVKKQERVRGDASQEDRTNLETAKQHYESLKKLLAELSEALGADVPTYSEVPSEDEEDELAAQLISMALEDGALSLWPSEETRDFYEKLVNIRELVPCSCFKESEISTTPATASKEGLTIDEIDMEDLENEHSEMDEVPAEPASTSTEEVKKELIDIEVENSRAAIEMREQMKAFLDELTHCLNQERIDEAAPKFVKELNTKINRRKLVRFLFSEAHPNMLPFCARLVTTLGPVMPDVPVELTALLIERFREIISGKHRADFLDKKTRIVQFIGELVKFGTIGRAEGLSCLRQLVYHFRGTFVELTCMMLETCGLYLFRNADSHPKMKQLIDVIMRKKDHIKDMKQNMIIENAYYSVCPDESRMAARPQRPPMLEFVMNLVVNISENNISTHLKLLRRLNWIDPEICQFAIWCLSSPWLVPFPRLRYLASAVSGLSVVPNHEWVANVVVDNILDTIRTSLEFDVDALNQKAIACVAFLGELYNYSCIATPLVMKVLYQTIYLPEAPAQWMDFTRIRMVAQLIHTIGEFFTAGRRKRKMDSFLAYWYRYYFLKRAQWISNMQELGDQEPNFPPEVEGEMREAIKSISKGIRFPKNLEEVEQRIQTIEATYQEKFERFFAGEQRPVETDGEEEGRPDRPLRQIEEEDEEDEEDEGEAANWTPERQDDGQKKAAEPVKALVPQEDDLEVLEEFERLMNDSMRATAPSSSTANQSLINVPAQVRQKLQRRVGFADGVNSEKQGPGEMRVSLVTKGKNNKMILKPVGINEAALEEQWKANQERERKEREDLKRLTLRHTQRMAREENDDDY